MNVPNAITLARLGLVPVVGVLLAIGSYAVAFPVFLVAALTDFVDGYLARRFGQTSRLGATLDPIADKLNMVVATVLLAWQQQMPLWLAIAIVARDVVIVAGALAYRAVLGHVDIKPTWLSKFNTVLEFALLLLLMAAGAGWIDQGGWTTALYIIVLATVVGSGIQYVWIWGRKAISERRRQ